jgi:hypothetical protein
MHQHLIAATVWKYRRGQGGEAMLTKVAENQLVLVSTGAGDWLEYCIFRCRKAIRRSFRASIYCVTDLYRAGRQVGLTVKPLPSGLPLGRFSLETRPR